MPIYFILLILFFTSSIFSQPVQFSRDPFVEVSDINFLIDGDNENSEVKPFNVKLKGIVWDKKNPAAVLEVSGVTQIVYESSMVFWLMVEEINSSSIVLKGNDKNFMIRLGEEIVP